VDVDRIAEPWGTRTPFARGEQWPVRTDMYLAPGLRAEDVDRWVQSASTLHSNGDAFDFAVKDGRIVGVRGRAEDRVNRGRLGPKDLFGWQAIQSPDRLRTPLVREGDQLVEADWDTAMDLIVSRVKELQRTHGANSIAFYTTGQLFLEEYYTIALLAHAGIGTNHVDGNTRLCTATAGESLKESFGTDGQPASYEDVDHTDVIALFGHNVAETQTVLWERMLDRLAGPNPPAIVCVDPRATNVAKVATVHLAPRLGTNLMLMNALLHEIVAHDWVDHAYVESHAVNFDLLERHVRQYPPELAAEVCDVPAAQITTAAELIGQTDRLLSTVLQGFYQSHQATASAIQVNNIHLIRGQLGKPGCGVLQMNGQPSAENTRECGADGDLPGYRNWANKVHIAELAKVWNVDPMSIPHYSAPTHLMQMMRYAEEGSIRFMWVTCTNPAVSLPELSRVREILAQDRLFMVVQDIFLTETARLADVVLPAATAGEKTGTFTNADRTVHLSEKAVDPPGSARPDFDIFLDFCRRMDFRNVDGDPLIPWSTPEEAFEAWKLCSAGRPCDYTALTYDKLRGSGVQWPCNESNPDGTPRLFADGEFWASAEVCETFGRDLITGAPVERPEYQSMNPSGKAVIRVAEFVPPAEWPTDDFPYQLTTGRTLYQFHTRTRTDRAPQLHDAAPDVWVEISAGDAEAEGIQEGDMLRVETAHGSIEGRARITAIRRGVIFVPFHYGDWDLAAGRIPEGPTGRAANELTRTEWDPVSKQPMFKVAAARVTVVARSDGWTAPAPTNTASRPTTIPDTPMNGGSSAVTRELQPASEVKR
jgi:anaerobic selenocysteine-containing dehydrogenase